MTGKTGVNDIEQPDRIEKPRKSTIKIPNNKKVSMSRGLIWTESIQRASAP